MNNTKFKQNIINRAKKILMKEKGTTETEAYHLLRKKAMNTRRSVYDVAEIMLYTRMEG